MVLEFGLLKSGLFQESEIGGEGLGADKYQALVKIINTPDGKVGSFYTFIWDSAGAYTRGVLIVHSALKWTIINGVNSRVTANGGVTWAASTTDFADMASGMVCKTLKTTAISANTTNDKLLYYTTDSGVTWTLATVPTLWTGALCLSFPTTTLAVAGLNRGTAARGIMRSTNGGVNWSICTTGPVANVPAISMFDGTTGYAVDSSNNIWKTTDGGVNWTDTTHNVASVGTTAMGQNLLAISATVCLYAINGNRIERYDNTAGTVTTKFPVTNLAATAGNYFGNFVVAANGKTYFAYTSYVAPVSYITLLRSNDDGVSWQQQFVIAINNATAVTQSGTDTLLSEYSPNQLVYLHGGGRIIKFDVSDGT